MTLDQKNQILNLFKNKSFEQIQKLLRSQLLSDLLNANIKSIDRDTFRVVIGLKPLTSFPITIDYDLSMESLIEQGKYDIKNKDVNSENFKNTKRGKTNLIIRLMRFNKKITLKKVFEEIDNQGFRPAESMELLAFGIKYPEEYKKRAVLALGNLWHFYKEIFYAPCLSYDEISNKRVLGIQSFITKNDYIAVIRK